MTARIPKLVSGIDVFSLPLSTREGFVLSRVDGVASLEDISLMVGIKASELATILDKLADLGAVELSWRPKKSAAVVPSRPSRGDEPENAGRQIGRAAVERLLATPVVPLYDELEVLAKADIPIELRKKILNGFYGLEGKDYYQLLGVTRSADKKEIKSAYFELSKLFHPDSQFGKELGTFKPMMETVFKRLTEAYEVLGRNARRKEYDEYLAATETTSALQQGFDQVQHEVEALDASAAIPIASSQPTAADDPRSRASVPDDPRSRAAADENEWPVTNPPPRTLIPPPSPEARREGARPLRPPASIEDRKAQARQRLRRGLPGAAGLRSTFPPVPERQSAPDPANTNAAERRDSAIRGLRQGLRQTGQNSGADPVMTHLRKARDAEQAGDLLGAASALQAALALQPNHKDIQAQYSRVSRAVTRNLADNYEKQARYEEKQGKWAAAATSWERVSEGRPEDPHAARATAEALMKASGDLHKAQRHAQRAVDAAPNDVTNVVVLARVFLAAGLRANARRELEKAVKLDPQNEMIKNLLREAR